MRWFRAGKMYNYFGDVLHNSGNCSYKSSKSAAAEKMFLKGRPCNFFSYSLSNMTAGASLGQTLNVRRFPWKFAVEAVLSRKKRRRNVLTEKSPPLSRSQRRPVTFIQ